MQSKPSWQVCRTGSPQRDGRRRWDEAYHLLLHWAAETEGGDLSKPGHDILSNHTLRGFSESSPRRRGHNVS